MIDDATLRMHARQRLENLPDDPMAARRHLCETVRELSESDGVSWHCLQETPSREWACCDSLAVGSIASLPPPWSNMDGFLGAATWDPELPDPRAPNRWMTLRQALRTARGPASDLVGRHYAPHGIVDVLRVVIYDDQRFVGYLGAVRFADAGRFGRSVVARLKASLRAILSAAIAIDGLASRDRGADVSVGRQLLFRADGTLDMASPGAADRLSADQRAALARRVRAFDRGNVDTQPILGESLVRLVGNEASRYLVSLPRRVSPCLRPEWRLQRRQREIAEYIAAGATAREVAEHLGLSHHTVRDHIKAIYRVLGVASRLELAETLGELPRIDRPLRATGWS
ncbi:MAG: LuxR family transcriptional regulator [Deltaproteobacteria bacterium]|nr:MAG: LuxR family transcriptional regulator [Deltaproteobacteria bacterium]